MKGTDPPDLRFDLTDPFRSEPGEAGHAVGPGPAFKLIEGAQLALPGGHDQLAGPPETDAVFGTELFELEPALCAEACLERSGGIVDTGVENAAVVARLVEREPVLAFQHHD